MKAYVIDEFKGIDSIHETDLPLPTPKENEVLIKIEAAGINPVDWKISKGYLQAVLPHSFPITLGWDAAGTIAACGKGVTNFEMGERVFAYTRKEVVHDGAFSEYITIDANVVAPMPKECTFAEAAAVPLSGLTAWQSLFDAAKLKRGETVLIHAGGGGVGGFAIQFAKVAGAHVIATASREKHEYVASLGADEIIDYRHNDFVEVLRNNYPDGIDVVFDTVGAEVQDKSFTILRKRGRLVSIVRPLSEAKAKQYGVQTSFVFVQGNGEQLDTIKDLIERGEVKIPVIETFSWEELPKALEQNQKGHTKGKLVLTITSRP